MTITGVWDLLHKTSGCAERLDSDAAWRRLFGARVAIDLSLWVFHARQQPELAFLASPDQRVAKVVFERALQLLRGGVAPIGVADGLAPSAKAGTVLQALVARSRFIFARLSQ